MHTNRTRRAGSPRAVDLDALARQVYEQAAPMVPATAMLALSGLGKELAAA